MRLNYVSNGQAMSFSGTAEEIAEYLQYVNEDVPQTNAGHTLDMFSSGGPSHASGGQLGGSRIEPLDEPVMDFSGSAGPYKANENVTAGALPELSINWDENKPTTDNSNGNVTALPELSVFG